MLIKEFRVINNCTEAEYKIGQLYATAMASKEQTGGGEGVEILKNEPYEKESGEKGQYTYKIFRLASRVPGFVRALAPAGALDLYEEAWNAYPYCKTVLKNGYMKDNFSIVYETMHVDNSRGELPNALNISEADLKKREVIMIDVANDPVDPKEYKPQEDPKLVHSVKAGRGPLTEKEWYKTCEPVMTCYKLVYIEFKWFGIQGKVESFLAKTIHNLFIRFHRQLFCWMDQWYGMTIEDIRNLEEEIKKDLDETRNQGSIVGTGIQSDAASTASRSIRNGK
ncbi:hypothetical protein BX666DRAFT_2027943 [Dichotomocladium elegans]|nr:hypothetical protein BX666DRAFT_2027943 [Dichotomocladium elegans]